MFGWGWRKEGFATFFRVREARLRAFDHGLAAGGGWSTPCVNDMIFKKKGQCGIESSPLFQKKTTE